MRNTWVYNANEVITLESNEHDTFTQGLMRYFCLQMNAHNHKKSNIKNRLGWTPQNGNDGRRQPNNSVRGNARGSRPRNQNRPSQPPKMNQRQFKSRQATGPRGRSRNQGRAVTQRRVRYRKGQQGQERRTNFHVNREDQLQMQVQNTVNNETYMVETMYDTVPLFIFCKRFTAIVNCGTSMTKIGSEVATRAVANGFEKKEKLLVLGDTQKRVQMVTILLGTRMARLQPVDCVIDPLMHPMSITLGLQALSQIGYRMVIDQVATEHHRGTSTNAARQENNMRPENIADERFAEEEVVAFLTDAERREMETWG